MIRSRRWTTDACSVLATHDLESRRVWAVVCWQKWTDEYCVRKASSTVDRLRYMCLATNTDQDCSVNEVDSNTGDKLNAQRNSMPGGANLIPAGSGLSGTRRWARASPVVVSRRPSGRFKSE